MNYLFFAGGPLAGKRDVGLTPVRLVIDGAIYRKERSWKYTAGHTINCYAYAGSYAGTAAPARPTTATAASGSSVGLARV